MFKALADRRRRRVCRYLESRQSPVSSGDVVSHLFAESQHAGPSRQNLEITLRHTHLPLLHDANIIEYTRSADRIEPGESLHTTELIIEMISQESATVA
ncbi:DUF7344 domain-containing protein [Natronorubrum halophilum]